jgi:hypothetical protein
MQTLETRIAKMIIDHIGRRPFRAALRPAAGGWLTGARGGATQGPVGETREGLRSS